MAPETASPTTSACRVVVAMSGGVDSSVAAARLVDAGHSVIGITLHLWDHPEPEAVIGRCCAPEDIFDAARVAAQLGIPHYVFDRRRDFERRIVEPFVRSYATGNTPSPCVECNRWIKIPELVWLADRLGAELVATGHYARIVKNGSVHCLHQGVDRKKDQSYFLYAVPPSIRERLRFPLGGSTKEEVRAEAVHRGLHGARKGESQELCFVPTGRYDQLVEQRLRDEIRPGTIVDEKQRVLGSHRGIHRFTLGQRRNLGVATGKPAYVVAIETNTGVVRLGSREELGCVSARLEDGALDRDFDLRAEVECVVRYRGDRHRARVEQLGNELHLTFVEPVSVVVPGQHAVLYLGDRLVGGGRIAETNRGA